MTIISELKRRNVFRVAGYYLAVAWLTMQVTDVLVPVLQLPEWANRLVFLLLAIGFPIALLLAWAFELTPDGIRRETEIDDKEATGYKGKLDFFMFGLLGVALIVFIWNYSREDSSRQVEPGEVRSVVVLPFENLMNDPDQDYFVEGMHDALITKLSKISSLHIISQTSAMHYAGTEMPLRDIARELDVDVAVEGSVLRAGDVVRVTTQLIDARTDRHIWADNFDRELVDILALYNDVAREITHQVRVKVTPEESAELESSRPVNPEAYELYLKGQHLCHRWSPAEMRQGAEVLQQAIELANNYAAPYASLAMCLVDAAFFEYLKPDEIDARARAAAEAAVRLDDRLAEAYVAQGSVHYYLDFNSSEAEAAYKRALALNRNSTDTLLRLSWFYAETGQFDDAYEMTRSALEIDPLSTAVRNAMGQVFYLNRNYAPALNHYEEALSLNRNDPSLNYYVGLAYEQLGEYSRAIEQYKTATELSDRAPLYLSALGHAYAQSGMREEAIAIREELDVSEKASSFSRAIVALGLGDEEAAIQLLTESVNSGDFHTLYLPKGPRFDPLRDDARFTELIGRFDR